MTLEAWRNPHVDIEDEELRCLTLPHEVALALIEREEDERRKEAGNGNA